MPRCPLWWQPFNEKKEAIALLSRATSSGFRPGLRWKTKRRAPGARLLSRGGKEGISVPETAREGSAGSAKVLGNSLMLILNK